MAFHDLYVIAVELERYELAVKHARSAFSRYPLTHPSIPRLAHDVAFLFIRLRHFASALALLSKAIPLMPQEVERAIAWSSLAWAAGGAGVRDRMREAEEQALQLAPKHPDFAPAIFVHLAEGARALGEWERAAGYAEAAWDLAREREAAALAQEARDLIQRVTARQPPEPGAEPDGQVESLTRLALANLARWKPRGGG